MVYKKAALVRRLIFITLPDRSRRAFTWARLPEFSGHLRDTMSTKIDCVIYLKSKLESEFTKLSIGKTPDTTSPRVSPRFPFPYHADRVERHACPVCRPVAPSPRRQARGDHLRLRRHERAGSGPNGRKTTRRISNNRL